MRISDWSSDVCSSDLTSAPQGTRSPRAGRTNFREDGMDIHEYQAKELLAGFGVKVPRGGLAYSPEQAVYRASEIGGQRWAVKAQIHSGARGKAGGNTRSEERSVGKGGVRTGSTR